MTERPIRGTIRPVQGIYRLFVVGFTLVSLSLVAAVGVAASAGKTASPDVVTKATAAVLSTHIDSAGVHFGNGVTVAAERGDCGKDKKVSTPGGEKCCKDRGKDHEHEHATGEHEHHDCDRRDDSS